MKKYSLFIFAIGISFLFISCKDDLPPVATQGNAFYADQRYYPTADSSYWLYRNDTISKSGVITKNIAKRASFMHGTRLIDTVMYVIQANTTMSDSGTTYDTVYVSKRDDGTHVTSTALQTFSLFPGISFPKEILLLTNPLVPGTMWSILDFSITYSGITISFKVTASYKGVETVHTDLQTYKDCAHIQVSVDVTIPLTLSINEKADFWFTKPFGMVVGDGSELVFSLLDGGFSLGAFTGGNFRHMHREVIQMNIPQPKCH